MLKVVVDTNQFVSAIIAKHGASSRLLQVWREHAYILITSKDILQEVRRVLQYPNITKKYCLQEEDINALINLIEHEALVLSDTINIRRFRNKLRTTIGYFHKSFLKSLGIRTSIMIPSLALIILHLSFQKTTKKS